MIREVYKVGDIYFGNMDDAYDSVAADELRMLREAHTPPEETADGYDDGYGELADQFTQRIKNAGSINALAWLGMQGDHHADCHRFLNRVQKVKLLNCGPIDLKSKNQIPSLTRF